MATTRKLMVEVVDARNLMPKDGHGMSSPYVILDFYGQRKKTRTIIRDLNPVWNEVLEFNVGKPSDVFGDILEVDVYHDRSIGPTTRNNFLVRLSARQFVRKGEEALIYYTLEKKNLFNWIQGDIGLKIYFADEVVPPPAPPQTPPPPPLLAEEVKPDLPPQPAEEPAQTATDPPPSVEAAAEPKPDQPANGDKSNDETPPVGPSEAEPSPEVENQPIEPEAEPPAQGVTDPVEDITQQSVEMDPDQVMASIASPSIAEVKTSGFNGPQPISRAASVSSFTSDASERIPLEPSSYDLVDKMHYLFVRVVKARSLPTTVWDRLSSSSIYDMAGHNFLGGICFDVTEIPLRDPPDSPLAPQWYRLEGGGAQRSDLMLATWVGTQADESFSEAWKTDTAGNLGSRSKVYQSPKLWYLRTTLIEAQDISLLTPLRESSFQVKAQLGFQIQNTKTTLTRNGSPSWNEDLIFVAAEPFSEHQLLFSLVENRGPNDKIITGVVSLPLTSIERRVDDRKVVSRWFTIEDPNEEKRVYRGRIHLRVCFDGGYHVMDEAANVCSDYRPSAKQLWKPAIGMVELGIVGCKNLLPMKTISSKGSTDAYAVAKYGNKWVQTRTISDRLDPKWNEQYTWKVYDPSTVLTIGVFDSWEVFESNGSKDTWPDFRIGKVRIRISTLETSKVYRTTYPLLMLSTSGLKKMGEIEVAVRFARTTPTLDFLHVYSQPLLPIMHHIKPLGVVQQELLRTTAVKIVAARFLRSEPPLRREVVTYMLDADSHVFSMRKVRANWFRIINVIAGVIDIIKWIDDTRVWKNATATVLVHALLVMLVWFPDLIVPTLAFYVFAVGAWNYRFRLRDPLPHFDPKISLADSIDRDELDEEFDAMPCSRPNEMVRARYDKLRMLGARVQTLLGDVATQGECVQALVTWRDPHATGIFVGLCFVVAFILYLVPAKMVAMAFGFYYFRHPIFRNRMPSPALNFFRRLPSMSDRIL
ncbi:LOW QUALITY PROTEIN: hypothetical protein RJ639_000815 [Escallonia herrerae]|uniref:C2 domain-containing protein n=1 Tax=Escallonia herrerae TaxID=1293975 RepID=A0AA88X9X5_9ASTE|nr:LOW QUALITY PROTEIN: hypothetical protein RJ639_000815 [Escallonia herrerae]